MDDDFHVEWIDQADFPNQIELNTVQGFADEGKLVHAASIAFKGPNDLNHMFVVPLESIPTIVLDMIDFVVSVMDNKDAIYAFEDAVREQIELSIEVWEMHNE